MNSNLLPQHYSIFLKTALPLCKDYHVYNIKNEHFIYTGVFSCLDWVWEIKEQFFLLINWSF